MPSARARLLTPWTIVVLAAASACGGWHTSCGNWHTDFSATARATRHPINGKVQQVNAGKHQIRLSHDAIPGFMDAMTMDFTVKEAWPFGVMKPGDSLRGILVVDGNRSWIEGVTVASASGTNAATAPRGSWVPADKGTPLPDVPLVDQDGHAFRLDRYRGHPLLMAFSYSRCPLPDYCPLTMQNLAKIEKMTASDPALRELRLLTVTIDPEHDTPQVLRTYGVKYATGDRAGQPFARWNLATGTPADVKTLAGFFGLDYYQEARSIVHSLRTAIVDPAGRVYKVFEGNDWQVDEVMSALRELASQPAGTR